MEEARGLFSQRKIANGYTGTDQFYSGGTCRISLPPGAYKLRVFKGLDYTVETCDVTIEAGKIAVLEVKLKRWIHPPEQGWYSADDHLHIPRPRKELDPLLSKWMQAEDLHFANLLQWGHATHFHNALQYAHGPSGVYQEGPYFLVSGQENPRTHFLGHTIILGASSPIDFRDGYLIYKSFWEEAQKQGALSGAAHFGIFAGAQTGLAIDLPGRLMNFIEVLQFNAGIYEVWYDILNSGFRMAPTAGTDYGCGESRLPGRERFYTKVEGPLTYKAWLEGIRRGRTFVTNGPILEFHVNGKEIGDEVALDKPGTVILEGCVRFDPERDKVLQLEVIQNGQLLKTFSRKGESPEIRFKFEHEAKEASWLALRASGGKQNEVAHYRYQRYAFIQGSKPSLAHTGAIYVTLKNAPGLTDHPRAKALARAWLARLEDFEERLRGGLKQPADCDAAKPEHLLRDRAALLEGIEAAKKYFANQAR